MWIRWAIATFATLWAGPAFAEPVEIGQIAQGVVYYNRPGATLADHDAELSACIRDTLSAGNPTAGLAGQGPVAVIIYHMVWEGPLAGLQSSKVENCMMVRGWRAVRVPQPESAEVAGLSGPDLEKRLTPWIGAAAPHGDIVRAFNNEAAHPSAYKTASRPAHVDQNQLSFRLNAETTSDRSPLVHPPAEALAKLDPQWTGKALKPTELAAAPAGSALIVARVTGISNRWGNGVVFRREGETPPGIAVPGGPCAGPGRRGDRLSVREEGGQLVHPGRAARTMANFRVGLCGLLPGLALVRGESR
jgi:hypothetical protein